MGLGPRLSGASVEANAEALLKTLVCDPKRVFLIVRKLKTIILLKELRASEVEKPPAPWREEMRARGVAGGPGARGASGSVPTFLRGLPPAEPGQGWPHLIPEPFLCGALVETGSPSRPL